MKRMTLFALCTLILAVVAARSDEASVPPGSATSSSAVATIDDVTEPVIPKRTLTFETSQEPLSRFTDRPDSSVEPQYVATIEFIVPRIATGSGVRTVEEAKYSNDLRQLEQNRSSQFLREFWSLHQKKRDLISRVPENRLPPKALIDDLIDHSVDLQMSIANGRDLVTWHQLAPTPERAKQLVEALLRLYDYGVSYPVQAECLKKKQAALNDLAKAREDLAKAKADIADADRELEKLKAYQDVTPQALATYQAQQRMLEVDLAGIKARIDACDKFLRLNQAFASRIEHLETLKITAEIELVGMEARHSTIADIVRNGEKRLSWEAQKANGRSRSDSSELRIAACEEYIHRFIAAQKAWEECPIKDGKVIIHPVKWTQPPQTSPPGSSPPTPQKPSRSSGSRRGGSPRPQIPPDAPNP